MSNETVGDFIDAISRFPRDWPVKVATPAGGGIAVEHREIRQWVSLVGTGPERAR